MFHLFDSQGAKADGNSPGRIHCNGVSGLLQTNAGVHHTLTHSGDFLVTSFSQQQTHWETAHGRRQPCDLAHVVYETGSWVWESGADRGTEA